MLNKILLDITETIQPYSEDFIKIPVSSLPSLGLLSLSPICNFSVSTVFKIVINISLN